MVFMDKVSNPNSAELKRLLSPSVYNACPVVQICIMSLLFTRCMEARLFSNHKLRNEKEGFSFERVAILPGELKTGGEAGLKPTDSAMSVL